MLTTESQDSLQQDIDLIQEYNSILDEFKKRHGMLVDVAEKTQLKIKQVTGLRDGVSVVKCSRQKFFQDFHGC